MPATGWDSPPWIFPPASFAPLNSRARTRPSRIQEEIQQLRPKEVLYGSSAPLFEGVRQWHRAGRPSKARVPCFAHAGYAETPLDDWIFAPDHAIPLLENHFGVLSLEGFGLAGQAGGGGGGGRHPLLRPLHAARNA